jgi:hypothetical protein
MIRDYSHLIRAREASSKVIRAKRMAAEQVISETVHKELANAPLADKAVQKLMLAMLYWAEGSKHEKVSGVRFVNTDPSLALLYLTLLRNCYLIDEDRLKIRLHLHAYHDKEKAMQFWSKMLKIPRKRFGKLYIKKRVGDQKKRRENFMGICFIYYSEGVIRKELMEMARQLPENLKQNSSSL